MKLQKNILLTFSAICLIFLTIFLYSCNKEEQPLEQIASIKTKADELVASKEFRTFDNEILKFQTKVQSSKNKLSKSERMKVIQILSNINSENSETIFKEVSTILGFDIFQEISKIQSKSAILQSDKYKDISKKELMIALSNKSERQMDKSIRLKSGSESSGGERSKCRKVCDLSYSICMGICLFIPGGLPTAGCALVCTANYLVCIYGCDD